MCSLSRVVSKRWQFYCPGPSRLPSPLDQTTVNLICFCLIDLMIFDWSGDFLLIWWFLIDLMIFYWSDDFWLIWWFLIDLVIFNWSDYFELIWWFLIVLMISNYSDDFQLIRWFFHCPSSWSPFFLTSKFSQFICQWPLSDNCRLRYPLYLFAIWKSVFCQFCHTNRAIVIQFGSSRGFVHGQ